MWKRKCPMVFFFFFLINIWKMKSLGKYSVCMWYHFILKCYIFSASYAYPADHIRKYSIQTEESHLPCNIFIQSYKRLCISTKRVVQCHAHIKYLWPVFHIDRWRWWWWSHRWVSTVKDYFFNLFIYCFETTTTISDEWLQLFQYE